MEKFEVTEEVFSYGKTVMINGIAVFDYMNGKVFCVSKDGIRDVAVFKVKKYEKI